MNESAATLRWLTERPPPSAWSDVQTSMRRIASNGQLILQLADWDSDFWLARSAVPTATGLLAPRWMPPEGIDQWPDWEAQALMPALADQPRRSNNDAFQRLVQSTPVAADPEGGAADALEHYYELKSSLVPRVFDVPAIQTEHVRAWLGTSFGHLLMSAALSPQTDVDAMANEVLRRLYIALEVASRQQRIDQFGERQLEVLYNSRILPDGRLQVSSARVGQGEEWRDHWLALTLDIDPQSTLDALQMAAKLMRCPSVLLGLARGFASQDPQIRTLSVAVLRRWLLTLHTMAWLEEALESAWTHARPKDLCCFALNATKPEWPRRVIAISHRSRDIKPQLRAMRAWRASRFAIDANYVPSWETNVGMIWGLFAATPVIVRVDSPAYADSLWCRRERELTDYLLQSDFMTSRWIVDLDQSELPRLDRVVDKWSDDDPTASTFTSLPEFPPLTEICSPKPMPAWEARMMRAGAGLRQMHRFLQPATSELVNKLALHLQNGLDLPGTAPTNNPNGWREYGEIFREAAESSGTPLTDLAVRLPDDYGELDTRRDLFDSQRIPDLQSGTPALRDILVAIEWLRVEYQQFVERNRGDFLAINCQAQTIETWTSSEEVSLHRGLAAMRSRLPVPLWIIQLADQEVEHWPLIGEVPIFTEHVSAQFGWMLEAAFDRRDSQQRYAGDSGLILSPALAEQCRTG